MSSFLVNTLRAPFRFVFLVAAAVSSPHFGQTGKRGCFDEALPAFDEADRQHIRTRLPGNLPGTLPVRSCPAEGDGQEEGSVPVPS